MQSHQYSPAAGTMANMLSKWSSGGMVGCTLEGSSLIP
jgi:hypothetical protein